MEHPEISDGSARRELMPIIKALFMGVTLKLPQGRLCYRGANEELPELPRAAGDVLPVATREGLFESRLVTAGGEPVDERWIGVGDFSALRERLEVLEAPADLATAARAAFSQKRSGTNPGHVVLEFENGPGAEARPTAAPRCRA